MFRSRRSDRLLGLGLGSFAALAGAIVVFVVGFLLLEAVPALRHIGAGPFVRGGSWHPSEGSWALAPMLAGTLLVTAGAVLIATPLGIGSAVFCRCYAPPALAGPYRRLIELLAGLPSVVYGLWGLVVLVPRIGSYAPPGASLLAGILIVALMILPTVALLADASLAAVPESYVRGAAALGLTRAAALRRVVLPAARSGILAGVFLATARAIGETMAVLMVSGNVARMPGSLFDPVRALTANIALEMAYAMGDHRAALFVSGLALMAMVVALVAVAEVLGRGRVHV